MTETAPHFLHLRVLTRLPWHALHAGMLETWKKAKSGHDRRRNGLVNEMAQKVIIEQYKKILNQSGLFNSSWLAMDAKACAPYPAPGGINAKLMRYLEYGCRSIGCEDLLVGKVRLSSSERISTDVVIYATIEELFRHTESLKKDVLIATADLSAGMFISGMDYALIAGVEEFMKGVDSFGVDYPREDFEHYAGTHPTNSAKLFEVAREYAPRKRSWRTASEVPPDSSTGKQLQLMEDFIHGRIEGAAFARQWLNNRSQAIDQREMLTFAILHFLDELFYAIDDSYTIDPSLRDEDDMTDEQLRDVVRACLTKIRKL
ncbi:colicin immunity domain-containing protein [Streptomyces sp. 7-21]|jgi:hypothetical protein|uniref:colicin immunity domain-containing protein n=1 Tax=Streptomyces sp. 7-21 TaxID=2802283 RepID=UPI00191D96E3|nr:colicin immunity domain-containing protein [Streptomyces sp. 7-21]MBL1065206.1 hypothetical protein [Streptomyces sp. 7-21]